MPDVLYVFHLVFASHSCHVHLLQGLCPYSFFGFVAIILLALFFPSPFPDDDTCMSVETLAFLSQRDDTV